MDAYSIGLDSEALTWIYRVLVTDSSKFSSTRQYVWVEDNPGLLMLAIRVTVTSPVPLSVTVIGIGAIVWEAFPIRELVNVSVPERAVPSL